MSLRVESFGDCINFSRALEELEVHSVFKNVINLKTLSEIISLVTPAVGKGPNNIVVEANDLSRFQSAGLEGKLMFLKEFEVDFGTAKKYDSGLFISKANLSVLFHNLQITEQIITKESSPFSSAFLLDEFREQYFITTLQINIKNSIKNAFNDLMKGSLDSVKKLKGVGFGLTPQGDDLINGVIIALYFFEQLYNISTRELRNKIYHFTSSSNLLSRTFIYYSSIGRFYQHFKNYLLSILSEVSNVECSTREVLKFGETSGADVLTGFVISLKKFFEGGLLWQ